LALSTLVLLAPAPALPADAPEGCVPVARIVSIQGSVQIQRSGQTAWSVVRKLDTVVCQGDVLHAGPRSRAALLIDPETLVRLDQSSTLSIRQTPDETIVEFTKDPGLFQRVVTAPNPCGAGYFISRFPRKFRVLTPFVNASVEGTEFLVAMRCESALVAVFEGRVRAEEVLAAAIFSLKEGESVEAGVGQPAAMKLVVKPVDAVQWALYYPPLTEAAPEAADQKCDQADNAARSVCLVQRAEQRLRSGRVEEAEADVQTLLTLGLGDGDAYALLSTIQVVKNDKAAALDLANRATELSPNSPRAWIALSYAHQATFDLEKALTAANKTAELAPGSATAQARVAELLMSLGRIREAEKAAKAAVAANPNDSRAHMVLGFVHLAQIDTKAAREDFLNAIERDSTEPLARLGLGLAIIRDGDLKAGREQIEIAVALDPTNSLLRSYVGKAYYEENTKERDQLAATQFGIAKQLDPKDPTPWFYDAILKQTQNRPVEALEDLQRSIDLNNNRAAYRSRLLLDEDQAARSASVAKTYDDLGFRQAAIAEAARSLSLDPSSSSAHWFMSEALGRQESQEITRASELLRAQLLQPLNSNAIQPQAAFTDLAFLAGTTAFRPSYSEYSYLFSRKGLRAQLSGVGGTHETWGDQASLSAMSGVAAFTAGQFHYQTDGFRSNSDITHDIYDAYLQVGVRPGLDLQAEVRSRTTETGDIALRGDPDNFDPLFRRTINQDVARAGAHINLAGRGDLLLSAIHAKLRDDNFFPDFLGAPLTSFGTQDSNQVEALYSHRVRGGSFLVGIGGYELDTRIEDVPQTGPCPLPQCTTVATGSGRSLYGLLNVQLSDSAFLLVGSSYDSLEDANLDVDELSFKFGFLAAIAPRVLLRAAAFQSVKPALIASQTLQPTEMLGFSQFSDDANGTVSNRVAIALDTQPSRSTYAGIEVSRRSPVVPIDVLNVPFFVEPREETMRAYVHWVPTSRHVVSLGYAGDVILLSPNDALFLGQPTRFQTESVPLSFRLFGSLGFFGAVTATYWRQRATDPAGLGLDTDNTFGLVDLTLGYRLPRRMGIATLDINNLFDRHFSFHDTNFLSVEASGPRLVPERTALARITLYF
jgi:Flp pilus assembly protein TadD